MKRAITIGALMLAAFFGTLVTGCGSGDKVSSVVRDINKNNVMRLASCYAKYQMMNNYKGPKNMEEFKAFLALPDNAATLTTMGMDPNDIDASFVSERDDEEIIIRWGVPGTQRGCYEPVTFEATGQDGSRLVGFANGVFEEVDDEQTIKDMMAGKHKPGTDRMKTNTPKFDKSGNQIN